MKRDFVSSLFNRRAGLGVLTALFLWLSAFSASAQSIDLKLKNATLREALGIVAKQTDTYLVFNEEEIGRQPVRLTMTLTDKTLEETLDRIFEGIPFNLEYTDNSVIIKPAAAAAPQPRQNELRGKITDEKGGPVVGATVTIEGTTEGVVSNPDGTYTLKTGNRQSAKIVYSFVGMETERRAWNGQQQIDVVMTSVTTIVDNVVVTGYQTLNARESASAVTTVAAEKIMLSGVNSIDKMLQGVVPGMMVLNSSGEPSATPKIRIRGNATINGNKSPVWVVDGVILEQDIPFTASDINSEDAEYLIGNAISGLNPQDIETITVLKDASATAIYGVKAANGVIVLTTKKGREGPAVITYNGDFSVTPRPSYSHYDRMNATQRMELSRDIIQSGLNYPRVPSGESYEGILEELFKKKITQEEFGAKALEMQDRNTDWFKELFRPAFTTTQKLTVSGGTEKTKYYFSAGYDDQNGAARGSDSKRFNSVARIDMAVNDWLSFWAKTDFSTTRNDGFHTSVNPFDYAYSRSRTLPLYNPDGSYYMYKTGQDGFGYNIMNELDQTGSMSNIDNVNSMLALDIRLLPGLKYGGVFSFHNSNTRQRNWATEESYFIAGIRKYEYGMYDETAKQYQDSELPYGGILAQGNTRKTGYTVRNTLSYANSLAEGHDLNIMAGVEARANNYKGVNVTGYGWNPDFGEVFMPVYTQKFISSYVQGGRLLPRNTNTQTQVASFFGTMSYTFKNRYVINGNIRSDGSNKFGSDPRYRWLPTWSVAGKWIASSESFLSGQRWIDLIAFRGSYGLQGNIHEDSTPNLIVKFGGRNPKSGQEYYTIHRLPNPGLRWEKTYSWNAAVDFSFFDNRLRGSLDVYSKYTSDLIMEKFVAPSNGRGSLYMNAGKMSNAGFEGYLNAVIIRNKEWNWNLGFNFGRNVNQITLANGDVYSNKDEVEMLLAGTLAVEGAPIGTMYSFEFAGLSPDNGHPLFYDKDGRKVHMGEPQMMKLVDSGSIFPKLYGGFDTQITFRGNLSLSLAFAYNIGNVKRLPSMYADVNRVFDPLTNVSTNLVNRWRQPGDELFTDIPALYNHDLMSELSTDPRFNASREGSVSYWEALKLYNLADNRVGRADFLKLKSVALSYTIPQKLLSRYGISYMMLRLQATNLFTLAHKEWQGLDPESAGYNIPTLPVYSLALSISF